jgi:release factor H-coupled RctB family protein
VSSPWKIISIFFIAAYRGENMDNKVKVIKSEKSWMESNAIHQLEKIAELEGIVKAVGLPDLHVGKTPVGASFVTKDIIYPHIVGNDIGCGMALFSTGISRGKFKFDKVRGKLQRLDGLASVDTSQLTENIDLPMKEALGTIGSGNHFAEFQQIEKIYDEEALEEIGISKGDIYLLVHSGSRGYGEYILRKYIEKYSCQKGLKEDSEGYKEYFEEHDTAVEFGKYNRELIAYRLLTTIGAKDSVKVLDSVHNSITVKEINGEKLYVHRKGAAPADIGYVVIAGTRGSNSYIVKPEANTFEYAFSVAHGAGRRWNRLSAKERLENVYPDKSMREKLLGSNLIYSDRNVLYEEAPEAYKSIDKVIEDMMNEGMIKLVASLKPLITYKA